MRLTWNCRWNWLASVTFGMIVIATFFTSVQGKEPVLNDLFLHQWVQVDSSQIIEGTVYGLLEERDVVLPSVHVLLLQSGNVVHHTKTERDGKFSIQGVQPGNYSCVAAARNVVAAFSLQVLESSKASHLPKKLDICAIHKGGSTVRELLNSQRLPGELYTVDDVESFVHDPIEHERRFADTPSVQLNTNGKLVGRLALNSKSKPDAKVFVLQGGRKVGQSSVDSDGRFEVGGLKDGVYNLVTAGSEIFGALAFRVVSDNGIVANGSKLISFNQNRRCQVLHFETIRCVEVFECMRLVAPECVVQIVPQPCPPAQSQPNVKPADPETPNVEPKVPADPVDDFIPKVDNNPYRPDAKGDTSSVFDPFAANAPLARNGYGGGGSYGGSYGGGGGGGSGGRGFAGIAGIAGLATVAGILASNETNNQAAVVSPIVR